MKKRITLLSVFICLFMLCTAMFAVTTAKANADGETYTVTFETPMANDYDIASSADTWIAPASDYKMPVLNDEGGITLTRDASASGTINYAMNVGKYTVTKDKTYVAVISVKTDSRIRFVLSSMKPNWAWKVMPDNNYENADYVDYRSEFTATAGGALEFIFQVLGGSGNIYVKNFKVYEKNNVTVNGGTAIGTLPEIPVKTGYKGSWTIDGVAIDKDTVYDYGADKTAVVTYKKVNMLTFLPENYYYDMAKDLSCWTDYQMPVLQDDGSALLNRPEGMASGTAYNYLAGSNKLPIQKDKKYILTFDMKCDNIHMNIATNSPGWKTLGAAWFNHPDFVHYEYEYTAPKNGNATIIFQTDAGSGNVYLKNFKFYEKIEKQFDGETAIGELPEITEKTGYVSYWAVDGEKITADTVYNYGTDKTATVVRKKINNIDFVDNVYDHDLASSLEYWTRYNKPVLNDDGGVTLTRSDDETVAQLNYAVLANYKVTAGKTYLIKFAVKGNGRFAFAVETPEWVSFADIVYRTPDAYVEVAYEYTAKRSESLSFIFQFMAGDTNSANVSVKDFRFYEKVADGKTVAEGEKFGELATLTENVGHFYRLGWTIDGVEVTADTICDFAHDAVIVKKTFNAEGHTATKVDAVAPDCENDGVKEYYDCSCGKHFADAEGKTEITDLDAWKAGDGKLDALGHSAVEAWTNDETNHWHVCDVCGERIDETAHTYDDGVVTTDPTCTAKGVKTFTCTVCGHTKTEDVNAKGHSAVEAWTNDETNHWHECANGCGEHLDETAHTYDDGVVTTEPTCTAKGVKTFTCTVCGHTKTEDVSAKGHSAVEAWTNDETNHWHECANGCGEHIDETAHTYDDGEVTTEPTCTAKGVKTFTCTVCGHTRTEDVDKVAHTPSTEWSKDGTNHWHVCDVCGEKLGETAHTYDDGVVTTEPTCTEDGEKTYTCTECGHTKTETVEKTGHVDGDDDGVCDVCGEKLKKDKGCNLSVSGMACVIALVAVFAVVTVAKRYRKENK